MKEIAAALVKAQRAFGPALKTSSNPHFKSRYADLASCYEASRPAMVRHGLSTVQLPGRRDDGTTTLTTMLLHVSGEFIGEEAGVKVAETAQAVGSAMTYLRRYAYSAMIGLATEDDDGVAASPQPRHDAPAERRAAPQEAAPPPASADRNDPPCPKCKGAMWDNRVGKKNPKSPDFKCRDKACDGVIWPPRSSSSRPEPAAAPAPYATESEEIPF